MLPFSVVPGLWSLTMPAGHLLGCFFLSPYFFLPFEKAVLTALCHLPSHVRTPSFNDRRQHRSFTRVWA
jgi:hypothetical protein